MRSYKKMTPIQIKTLLTFFLFLGILAVVVIPFEDRREGHLHIGRTRGFILGNKVQGQLYIESRIPEGYSNLSLSLAGDILKESDGSYLRYDFDSAQFGLEQGTFKLQASNEAGNSIELIKSVEFIPLRHSIAYFIGFSVIILTSIAMVVPLLEKP